MTLTIETYLIVCPLVFLAGFIDSIAGGGGLISLPAYLISGLPAHLASGTNKMSAMFGTTLSTYKYAKEKKVAWRAAIPAVCGALPGAAIGARLQLLVPERIIYIFMMCMIPVVALVTLLRKNKMPEEELPEKPVNLFVSTLVGLVIGTYDGFFGPGTGTFLMMAFTMFCGLNLVMASGSAKVVNLASNLASMVTFLFSGQILYLLALPAAACSMLGNYLGARLAVKKGARAIKPMFYVVLTLLMLTVLYRFLFK